MNGPVCGADQGECEDEGPGCEVPELDCHRAERVQALDTSGPGSTVLDLNQERATAVEQQGLMEMDNEGGVVAPAGTTMAPGSWSASERLRGFQRLMPCSDTVVLDDSQITESDC